MTTFESMRRGRPRSRGCPVCGEKNTGQIQIALGEVQTNQNSLVIKSMSRRLCERHAVLIYQVLEGAYERALESARGGTDDQAGRAGEVA